MYFKLQLSAAMHSINPWGSRSADVNQCSFTGSSTATPVYTSLGSVHSNLTMDLLLHFIFPSPLGKYIYINICMYAYVYVCMHVRVSSSLRIAVTAHVWMVRKGAEREAGAWKTQSCTIFLNKTACLKSLKLLLRKGHRVCPKMFLGCCIYSSRGFHTPDAAQLGAAQGPALSFPLLQPVLAKIIRSRESATGICSFCIPARHCQRGCLLRCAVLFTATRTPFPLVTEQLWWWLLSLVSACPEPDQPRAEWAPFAASAALPSPWANQIKLIV